MRETILEFGPHHRLIGVLTRPESAERAGGGVAVVITNSGIIHRVGANRVHVRLARALAAAGVPCLRYDLPGIGDSARMSAGRDVETANQMATAAALTALTAAGVASRFVMIGLCSGADHSFRVSVADPRVIGAVLIDPTTMFSTSRHRLNLALRAAGRALRPRFWGRLLAGRYRLSRASLSASMHGEGPGAPRSLRREELPEQWAQARDAFQLLIDRKTKLLLLTTRHNGQVYSYRGQLQDAFPELRGLRDILTTANRPRGEHTFSSEADRDYLEATVLGWLAERILQRKALTG